MGFLHEIEFAQKDNRYRLRTSEVIQNFLKVCTMGVDQVAMSHININQSYIVIEQLEVQPRIGHRT